MGEEHNEKLFPGSEYMKQCYVKMTKYKINTHSLELRENQLPEQ